MNAGKKNAMEKFLFKALTVDLQEKELLYYSTLKIVLKMHAMYAS